MSFPLREQNLSFNRTPSSKRFDVQESNRKSEKLSTIQSCLASKNSRKIYHHQMAFILMSVSITRPLQYKNQQVSYDGSVTAQLVTMPQLRVDSPRIQHYNTTMGKTCLSYQTVKLQTATPSNEILGLNNIHRLSKSKRVANLVPLVQIFWQTFISFFLQKECTYHQQ